MFQALWGAGFQANKTIKWTRKKRKQKQNKSKAKKARAKRMEANCKGAIETILHLSKNRVILQSLLAHYFFIMKEKVGSSKRKGHISLRRVVHQWITGHYQATSTLQLKWKSWWWWKWLYQCEANRWFSLDVIAAMLVHRTIEKKSFGNLTLLLCKIRAIICYCFVHQHGRLITWLKTIYKIR